MSDEHDQTQPQQIEGDGAADGGDKLAYASGPSQAFNKAMFDVDAELDGVARNRKGHHQMYANIDDILRDCKPILKKHGLRASFNLFTHSDSIQVVLNIVHRDGWRETYSGLHVPFPPSDPQKMGSAITYGKRYIFASALALPLVNDDDGRGAQQAANAKPRASGSGKGAAALAEEVKAKAPETLGAERARKMWSHIDEHGLGMADLRAHLKEIGRDPETVDAKAESWPVEWAIDVKNLVEDTQAAQQAPEEEA